MKKFIVKSLWMLGIAVVLGIVVSINLIAYGNSGIDIGKIPGFISPEVSVNTDVCSDPEVIAYFFAQNQIMSKFAGVDASVQAHLTADPPDLEGLNVDAQNMRLFATAVRQVNPPPAASGYHDAVVSYLDAYASTLEALIEDSPSVNAWVKKMQSTETNMKTEREKLTSVCN